jgi:hypothetical protein
LCPAASNVDAVLGGFAALVAGAAMFYLTRTRRRKLKLKIPEKGLEIYLTDDAHGWSAHISRRYKETPDGYLLIVPAAETILGQEFKHFVLIRQEDAARIAGILSGAGLIVSGRGGPGAAPNSWGLWFLLPDFPKSPRHADGSVNNVWPKF